MLSNQDMLYSNTNEISFNIQKLSLSKVYKSSNPLQKVKNKRYISKKQNMWSSVGVIYNAILQYLFFAMKLYFDTISFEKKKEDCE